METDFFGALRCMKAVIPGMRERRHGCIINVTLIAWPNGSIEDLSGRRPETLEAQREPFAVREVLRAIWQVYGAAVESL
jgi:hypothetical protein